MKLSPEDFEKIKSFLSSDKRCMFVTGSAMYNKHKLVMAALDTLLRDSTILFRANALLNIPVSGFLDWVGVSKIPASGQNTEFIITIINSTVWGIPEHVVAPLTMSIAQLCTQQNLLFCTINSLQSKNYFQGKESEKSSSS